MSGLHPTLRIASKRNAGYTAGGFSNKRQQETDRERLSYCIVQITFHDAVTRGIDKYLVYKGRTKILEKWRFISQHILLLVRYTDAAMLPLL